MKELNKPEEMALVKPATNSNCGKYSNPPPQGDKLVFVNKHFKTEKNNI